MVRISLACEINKLKVKHIKNRSTSRTFTTDIFCKNVFQCCFFPGKKVPVHFYIFTIFSGGYSITSMTITIQNRFNSCEVLQFTSCALKVGEGIKINTFYRKKWFLCITILHIFAFNSITGADASYQCVLAEMCLWVY